MADGGEVGNCSGYRQRCLADILIPLYFKDLMFGLSVKFLDKSMIISAVHK
jgi:hypothetical protein